MEEHGFIREQFDIKLLILYILRRLPAEIDGEALAGLVLIDGGFNYFDYKICLAELEETAQIQRTATGYRITDKGSRNCEIMENGLPFSVREKARRLVGPVATEMRRQQMILTDRRNTPAGIRVRLRMSDGLGELIDLALLARDNRQAEIMERNFKQNAERCYQYILHTLAVGEKQTLSAIPLAASQLRTQIRREDTHAGAIIHLRFDDGAGEELLGLKLLLPDALQAETVERNFKEGAEEFYRRFSQALADKKGSFE